MRNKTIYNTIYRLKSSYDYDGVFQHAKDISYHEISYTSQRNSLPANWDELKHLALERDNYTCRVCGNKEYLNVHHIIHRAHGGSNELKNLLTICIRCHSNQHPGNARLRAQAEKLMP